MLIIARPEQLIDTTRRAAPAAAEKDAAGSRAAAESGDGADLPRFANFHDLLKARVLQIRQPIQIIRRSTWDESVPPPAGRSRQDEASRAWNLHVALYYKAGGVPWRLPRNSDRPDHLLRRSRVLPQQRRRPPWTPLSPRSSTSAATG